MDSLDDLLIDVGQALDRRAADHRRRPGAPAGGESPRWLALTAAASVVAVAGGVYWTTQRNNDPAATIAATTMSSVPPEVAPTVTTPPGGADTTPTTLPVSSLAQPLTIGMYGDDVKLLQQRLTDLHFAPGPVDGVFGENTQQAVWAYKKLTSAESYLALAGSNNATEVDDALWQQMQAPMTVEPRRPQGAGSVHVEIYLPQQVLVVFTDDEPSLIAHISSGQLDDAGQPEQWCEVVSYDTGANGEPLDELKVSDECAYAKTPGGVFKVRRHIIGNRQGPLGGMYNPVYFNYGIAVHGAQNVPKVPVSHGCIRINMDIAETFPTLVPDGSRVFVWGHDGREPEEYSENDSLPSFNYPNPNSTSTTSSTSTTVAPSTTVEPAQTTVNVSTTAATVPAATSTTPSTSTPLGRSSVATLPSS